MSTRWCCRMLQDEFGPMDFDELLELAAAGTLGPGDLVRRETDDVWRAATKYPELRRAFVNSESETKPHPPRPDPPLPSQTPPKSRERASEPTRAADEQESIPVLAPRHLTVRATPRQRWSAWLLTVGLLLVLFLADRQIAAATPTFPQPRQVREQLAGLQWFLGTGPWSQWECRLLWLDSLVILWFIAGWISRRVAR